MRGEKKQKSSCRRRTLRRHDALSHKHVTARSLRQAYVMVTASGVNAAHCLSALTFFFTAYPSPSSLSSSNAVLLQRGSTVLNDAVADSHQAEGESDAQRETLFPPWHCRLAANSHDICQSRKVKGLHLMSLRPFNSSFALNLAVGTPGAIVCPQPLDSLREHAGATPSLEEGQSSSGEAVQSCIRFLCRDS